MFFLFKNKTVIIFLTVLCSFQKTFIHFFVWLLLNQTATQKQHKQNTMKNHPENNKEHIKKASTIKNNSTLNKN